MKHILPVLAIVALAATFLYSCSEDFTVAAPYRQITVVAGILDQDDTAHYIRIQKAFMDENKSAIEMAKDADSSFYDSLNVTLIEYDSARTKVLGTTGLYRVDLNKEGYQKNDPVSEQQFFTSPSYAYKFVKTDLSSRRWYKLVINNVYTGRSDSSDYIGIINTDSTRALNGFYVTGFDFTTLSINFANTNATSRYRLFVYMPKNGRMVEGYIKFNYVEKNVVTGNQVDKSVVFAFDRELNVAEAGKNFDLSVLNSEIFSFLSSSIGPAPANTERYMDSCDIYVYAASPEIYYYNIINLGQSGGLTGDNIQPNYTNFKSSNVIGVVGSRGMRVYRNAVIDNITLDSLKTNSVTQSLLIRGRSDH